MHESSSITKFLLKCRSLPKAYVLNLWLTTLLSRNIKFLEVEEEEFLDSSPLCRLSGIFQSETLVVFKLSGLNIVVEMPEFVSFPNLKELNVEFLDMHFKSDNVRLAEGFPLLEDLTFYLVRFGEKKENRVLTISMCTLNKLVINGVERYFSRIDIDTTHLQHMEYVSLGSTSIPRMQINLLACESLVSARVYISTKFEDEGEWFIKFLGKVNKLKELYLSSEGCTQVLSHWADSLPQFPNLTDLSFIGTKESMWCLLQRTPNLKVIACNVVEEDRVDDYMPPENVPL